MPRVPGTSHNYRHSVEGPEGRRGSTSWSVFALFAGLVSVSTGCAPQVEHGTVSDDSEVTSVSQSVTDCNARPWPDVKQYKEKGDPDVNYGNLGSIHQNKLHNRQRRLIVNSDGNDAWVPAAKVEAVLDGKDLCTVDAEGRLIPDGLSIQESRDLFLAERHTALEGGDVDAVVFEVTSGGFGAYTHDTNPARTNGQRRDWHLEKDDSDDIAAVEGDRLDPCKFSSSVEKFAMNLYDPLDGADLLDIASGYVRQEMGAEFYVGFRMNDWHDNSSTWYENNYSEFKLVDEPVGDYLFAKNPFRSVASSLPDDSDLDLGKWSQVDYAHCDVRNQLEATVKEVIQRHDVDGIQLNFMRHPAFFRRTAWNGGTANTVETNLMTDLMIRLRNQTNKEANLRSEGPLFISVLIPDDFDYALDLGLDVRKWIELGLVDIIVGGDYMQMRPFQETVQEIESLPGGHRVLFSAGFSNPRIKSMPRLTKQAMRGRAHEAWREGVDSIQLSNGAYGSGNYQTLYSSLSSVDTTSCEDMLHLGSFMGKGALEKVLDFEPYMSKDGPRPLVAPDQPLSLASGSTTRWSFRVGGGVPQAGAALYLTATAFERDADVTIRIGTRTFAHSHSTIPTHATPPNLRICTGEASYRNTETLMFEINDPNLLDVPTLKIDVLNDGEPVELWDVALHTWPSSSDYCGGSSAFPPSLVDLKPAWDKKRASCLPD